MTEQHKKCKSETVIVQSAFCSVLNVVFVCFIKLSHVYLLARLLFVSLFWPYCTTKSLQGTVSSQIIKLWPMSVCAQPQNRMSQSAIII